jgi:hypothetical protein
LIDDLFLISMSKASLCMPGPTPTHQKRVAMHMETPRSRLAEHLITYLETQVLEAVREEFSDALRRVFGDTEEYQILSTLFREGRPMSLARIARACGFTKKATTIYRWRGRAYMGRARRAVEWLCNHEIITREGSGPTMTFTLNSRNPTVEILRRLFEEGRRA